MVRIVYFAWMRQRLGRPEETVTPPAEIADIAGLIAWLRARGPDYAEIFAEPALIRAAVNQEMVEPADRFQSGDEIAFFPPVTGG